MRELWREFLAAAWIGACLDAVIGDPEGWWHPVRAIGWLISALEKELRRVFPCTPGGELAAGCVLAATVPACAVGASAVILLAAGRLHPYLRFACMCLMCGQLLAAKSLRTESMKVCRALEKDDVEGARRAVSRIVGRDTENLSEKGIIRAAVETVAENASDGVTAPLLWMLCFGPVGGFFYKAVNTMDSMVGYRNETYLYFGRAAARLDDVVNWIPARLTALAFVLAAFLISGCDGRRAWRIWRRDRRRHASPNSAQGESACEGAIGVRLAGTASFFGTLHEKPWIGDDVRPVTADDIRSANALMQTAYLLILLLWTAVMAGVVLP
ncbi:MAG: adenosylcobinamide-phosphate synthase CbiB [Clostridiales bacterium]|nr:adenosylcobinamide-phosphate synthase CbiB [Clostridiales bacterium]